MYTLQEWHKENAWLLRNYSGWENSFFSLPVKQNKNFKFPYFVCFSLYPVFVFLPQWHNSRFCLIVQIPKFIRSWWLISAGSKAWKYRSNSSYYPRNEHSGIWFILWFYLWFTVRGPCFCLMQNTLKILKF